MGEEETRGPMTGIEEKNPRSKEILLWISVRLGFHPILPYVSLNSQGIKVAFVIPTLHVEN